MKSLNVFLWMQKVLLFSQWFTICTRAQAFAIQHPIKDNNYISKTTNKKNHDDNKNTNNLSTNGNSNQHNHLATTNEVLVGNKKEQQHRNDKQLVKLEEVFESCLSRLDIIYHDNENTPTKTKRVQQYSHKYAKFVLESMANPGRHFHDVQHVFHIMNPYFKNLENNNDSNKDYHDDDNNTIITNDDPLLLLAALFHDVVYYNIDHGGLSNEQLQLLENFVAEDTASQNSNQKVYTLSPHLWSNTQPPSHSHTTNNNTTNQDNNNGSKLLIQTIARIYGYTPNNNDNHNLSNDDEISSSPPQVVTNEFLSTVCAAKLLHPLLHPTHILQIAIAIEATIPFRPLIILKDDDSQTTTTRGPLDQLYNRVIDLLLDNENSSYKLTTSQCRVAVQRASKLAFWDLANFATPTFLDYSYTLMPEQHTAFHHAIVTTTNPYYNQQTSASTLEEHQPQPQQPQQQQQGDSCPSSSNDSYTPPTYTYTFRDYYQAVRGQYKFFCFLVNTPKIIFPVFEGVPSHIHYLQDQTIHNLKVGQDYMATKLLTASILTSLFDDDEEDHYSLEKKTPQDSTASATSSSSSRSVAILFPNATTMTTHHDTINLLPTKLPTRPSSTTTTFEDDNHHKKNTTTATTKEENNNSFFEWDVYERLKNGPHNKQLFHWFDMPQSQLAANLYVTLGRTQIHKLVQEYCGNVYPQEANENDEHISSTQKSRLELLHALPQPWVIDLLERLLQIPTMSSSTSRRSQQLLVMLLENEFGVKRDIDR